jgi:predicted nucleotidyltransferase
MVDADSLPEHLALEHADREQIAQVIAALRDVLGDDLVGAYMHGSAVLGSLQAHSDIDVIAVSARQMRPDQKKRMVAHLLDVSGRYRTTAPPRPIELTIVVESEIRPWRYPPTMDFQYGEWWRKRFEHGEVEPWPSRANPDVAVLVTMAIVGEVTLSGPSPSDVFDAVPKADFIDALVSDLPSLLEDIDDDTTNVVLTLARVWSGVVSGSVQSKESAAEWALRRLPPEYRGVLRCARDIYLGTTDQPSWNDLRNQVRSFADRVVDEIAAARSAIDRG